TGSHHQSFKRCEAHRGVNAVTFANGRKRTTVAQVAGHQLERYETLVQEFCSALRAILVIDAVESVAANASTEPFVGTWVYDCWQWHLSMEPRIENSHLFFFSSRRRHTRWPRDWSSDVCSSD